MNKLEGIKEGDRVRVTMEGVFKGGAKVLIDGWHVESSLHDGPTNAPTFQIERIEQPLSIGDTVSWNSSGRTGELVKIHEGRAYVFHKGSPPYPAGVLNLRLSDLRRADPK